MRTLNQNRKLLWFTLFLGLVLAGSTLAQGILFYISWITTDGIIPLLLGFLIEVVTMFCLLFLLAGIVLSISSKETGIISVLGDLAHVKKQATVLFAWSLILALAGLLLYRNLFSGNGIFWLAQSHLLDLLTQYPFALNLNPAAFAEIPGYGGRSLLFWTYPYGFLNALTFSAINLFLIILTAFVVPRIVLGHQTLREAVSGSFVRMKKTWGEVTVSVVFLGIIASGFFLTYLLLQALHGIFTPPELIYDRPTAPWLALALIYYLISCGSALILATVGVIAARDLCMPGECKQIAGSPDQGSDKRFV